MRSKEIEQAIKKMEEVKDKNVHTFVEELEIVLSYISELEKENADAKEYADDVWRKQEELRIELEEQYINKQVIRDKIKELEKDLDNPKYDRMDVLIEIEGLKEILGE